MKKTKNSPIRTTTVGVKRAVLPRWHAILESLRTGNPPNGWTGRRPWKATAENYREALGLGNSRTILRDIKALREQGYEIDYDPQDGEWIWSNHANVQGALPTVPITEEELLAMLSAVFMSRSMLDEPATKKLEVFIRKLKEQIPGGFAHDAEDIGKGLSYKSLHKRPEQQIWTKLQLAILNEKVVKFNYISPWDSGTQNKERVIIPLHMALVDSVWYLYGIPARENKSDIRTYRLTRISDLSMQQAKPKSHSADLDNLRKSIQEGIGPFNYLGKPKEWIRLRMDSRILGFMQEYNWQPEPQVRKLKSGQYTVEIQTAQIDASGDALSFHPILPFILSWQPYVEVVSPHALRLKIQAICAKAAAEHE